MNSSDNKRLRDQQINRQDWWKIDSQTGEKLYPSDILGGINLWYSNTDDVIYTKCDGQQGMVHALSYLISGIPTISHNSDFNWVVK